MEQDTIIRAVQEELGLVADGKAGPQTWDALFRRFFPKSMAAQAVDLPCLVVTGGRVDARSEGVIATLLPEVQPYARELVSQAAKAGIVIKVISGLRTYAEQDALFAKRPKVTNARGGYSNHNFGLAFDIGVFQGGKYIEESPAYKAVGAIGLGLGLDWGGNWKSIQDEPHFELRPTWAAALSEKDLLAGLRERKAAGKALLASIAAGAFSLWLAGSVRAQDVGASPTEVLNPQVIYVFGGILGLLGIYVLILNAIAAHKKVFGRTPPFEVELNGKADSSHVDRLEVDIKGFATTKELERYQEETRVRSRGLEEQISGLRHELREECQGLKAAAENREESAAEQFEQIRKQLSETDRLLAKLDERSQNVAGTISNFDRKLDRLMAAKSAGQA